MHDDEQEREEVVRRVAAEVERYEKAVRLLREGKVDLRNVKLHTSWSDGGGCVRDPNEALRETRERLRAREPTDTTVGWVKRWALTVLWLVVFGVVVVGIVYGVYRTVG